MESVRVETQSNHPPRVIREQVSQIVVIFLFSCWLEKVSRDAIRLSDIDEIFKTYPNGVRPLGSEKVSIKLNVYQELRKERTCWCYHSEQ